MADEPQSAPTPRVPIAVRAVEERVVDVADRQEGVIDRRQLAECGLSGGAVSRWLERRRIHRRHPGVYILGHRKLSERGELIAALLYAGPGAALRRRSGAAWRGIVTSTPAVIEVVTPRRRKSVPGIAVRHLDRVEREMHNGLPVAPIPEILLDLATFLPLRALRNALAEADYRGLLDPPSLRAAVRGRPGSAAINRALNDHLPQLAHTRSELEVRFLELCERAGLPLPEVNVRVAGFLVDAHWPGQQLVVELDGGEAHGRPAAVVSDRNRDLALRELGYTVRRYSWHQVVSHPERVVADLRSALQRYAAP